jgi:membrane associated rhomboid family serine protease
VSIDREQTRGGRQWCAARAAGGLRRRETTSHDEGMTSTGQSGTGDDAPVPPPSPPVGPGGRGGRQRAPGIVSLEWLTALRRGKRPMPATMVVVFGCLGIWVASVATGSAVWSSAPRGPLDYGLARNAALIAGGEWWRALTYGVLNQSLPAVLCVLGLLFLAGLQVERTYGTARFLAILAPSWTGAALLALFVEPAHAYNAGTSGAMFGVAAAATIDLLRRGVPWYRTFWASVLAALLVVGFAFPVSVTWGAHAGGLIAGGVVGLLACRPETINDRRTTLRASLAGVVLFVASLAAVPFAARYTVAHGPIFIGRHSAGGERSKTVKRRVLSPDRQEPALTTPSAIMGGAVIPLWGRSGFDGGKGLLDACRARPSRSLNRWATNVTAEPQLALAA